MQPRVLRPLNLTIPDQGRILPGSNPAGSIPVAVLTGGKILAAVSSETQLPVTLRVGGSELFKLSFDLGILSPVVVAAMPVLVTVPLNLLMKGPVMTKYTELWEAILHEITIPLGKYAVAYDIGAIADELIILVDAATEQSGYALDPEKDFWRVIRNHAKPVSEIDRYMEQIEAAGIERAAIVLDDSGDYRRLSENEQAEVDILDNKVGRLTSEMTALVKIRGELGRHPDTPTQALN